MMTFNQPIGNTGTGTPLKVPDVDACPVCGQWIVLTSSEDGGKRWDKGTAEAIAVCVHDSVGELMSALLTWRCKRCGAEWLHGQFTKDNKST